MDRIDRLSCEVAIWTEIAMKYGLHVFQKQYTKEILVPEAIELSKKVNISHRPLIRAFDELRKAGILSARIQYRHGYTLTNPKKFANDLRRRLTRRIGLPHAMALPPYLRGKDHKEILHRIAEIFARQGEQENADYKAKAILHSAFYLENEPIRSSMAYSGAGPICLLLSRHDLKLIESELSLVRLAAPRRKRSAANMLGLPEGYSSFDVLVFEKKSSVAFPQIEEVLTTGQVDLSSTLLLPIAPEINAILLQMYPLRGEEAAERLVEGLRHKYATMENEIGK